MLVGTQQSKSAYEALPPSRRRVVVFLVLEGCAIAVFGFGFRLCQYLRNRLDGTFVTEPRECFGCVQSHPAIFMPQQSEQPRYIFLFSANRRQPGRHPAGIELRPLPSLARFWDSSRLPQQFEGMLARLPAQARELQQMPCQ